MACLASCAACNRVGSCLRSLVVALLDSFPFCFGCVRRGGCASAMLGFSVAVVAGTLEAVSVCTLGAVWLCCSVAC